MNGELRVESVEDYFPLIDSINLDEGLVFFLFGSLGSGKTTFVRTFLERKFPSGDSLSEVASPTFSVLNEYEFKDIKISHIDLYRLEQGDLYDSGIVDSIESSGVSFIEWPDDHLSSLIDLDLKKIKIYFDVLESEPVEVRKVIYAAT